MQENLPRTRVHASASVLESGITLVDGTGAGQLLLRGYSFEELVDGATFEEVAWLLWTGQRPTASQRRELLQTVAEGAAAAAGSAAVLQGLPAGSSPPTCLLAALALLPVIQPEFATGASAAGTRQAALLLGACAALSASVESHFGSATDAIATAALFRDGVAAGFLALARGSTAPPEDIHAFEQVLIVLADHELNPSTFAARVAASTRANMVTAVVAAMGTLSGPLHGGIERYVRTMLAAAESEGAQAVVERYERSGQAIPGFGHAVYRDGDPRARVMRRLAETLSSERGHARNYELTREIEDVAAWRRLPAANVDLYAVAVYRALGISDMLSSLVFATARVAGWCAHILEQYQQNRLIRPRAEYTGPTLREWAASAESSPE